MKLTDATVKNAHAKEKQYTLYDEKGLFLLVLPNGSKLWRWKYRVDGKEKRLSLGVYPEVSLKAARETRDAHRVALKAGTDPSAAKKVEKAEERAQGETFELVAREWHKKFLPGWTPGHAARILVSLEKDAFPWLGVIPIHELTAPQVLAVARRVESRGALETAHRLVGNIGQVCRYAVACGTAESDPTASLRGALPPAIAQHHATLTQPHEVGALLRAIDGYSGSFVVKCALRILPYVFTRPGELRGMEWSELELEGPSPTWTIPPARMEKHLEDFLVQNWEQTELGKAFDIFQEEGERKGQQYPTDTGPIDILAISKDKKQLLVVELKKGRASDVVVGQTLRYMRESDCQYGIYLIGWFNCERWSDEDPRRSKAPKISIDEARNEFAQQALSLCEKHINVASFVMNTGLRIKTKVAPKT